MSWNFQCANNSDSNTLWNLTSSILPQPPSTLYFKYLHISLFFFFFQYLVLVLNQSVTAQNEALIQGMEGLNKYELRNNFPSKLHYNRT